MILPEPNLIRQAQMRLLEEEAAYESFRRIFKNLRQLDASIISYFSETTTAWSMRVLKSLDLSEVSIGMLDDERLLRMISELLDRELDAADRVAAELSSEDYYLASLALEVDKTQQKAKPESTGERMKRKRVSFTESHTANRCKSNQQVFCLFVAQLLLMKYVHFLRSVSLRLITLLYLYSCLWTVLR